MTETGDDPVTTAPHQDQRDAWATAVAARNRRQRANRGRRAPKDPPPGSMRLRPSQSREETT